MAKSIRVCDGICELAATVGDATIRSLADQIAGGFRLGAALDAAGVTVGPVTESLEADARLMRQIVSQVTDLADATDAADTADPTPGTRRGRSYSGAPTIAARNAQLEQEVMTGVRTPESLFMLSREQVKSATFVERMPTPPGQGW